MEVRNETRTDPYSEADWRRSRRADVEHLADDRIARDKERKRATNIKILEARSDAELIALVKPIVDAAIAAAQAEPPVEG